jgi:hypothetical protein
MTARMVVHITNLTPPLECQPCQRVAVGGREEVGNGENGGIDVQDADAAVREVDGEEALGEGAEVGLLVLLALRRRVQAAKAKHMRRKLGQRGGGLGRGARLVRGRAVPDPSAADDGRRARDRPASVRG